MNTSTKIIANFIATAVWADGEFSELEQKCVRDIAYVCELESLMEDMESVFPEILDLTSDALFARLSSLMPYIDVEDKGIILALCLQLMGCDDYLADGEISNFYVLANILGVNKESATALLSGLTSDEEIVVEN